MTDVFVSTVPFATYDSSPLVRLQEQGIKVLINPLERRLQPDELIRFIGDSEVLIAGTEPITAEVMAATRNLRVIARVGVGLDNVDLLAAQQKGIQVTYTPDAPAPAVAELAIANMMALLRGVHEANLGLHSEQWHRYMGRRLASVTVGIIGVGRIGERVVQHLANFETSRILANDVDSPRGAAQLPNVEWVDKEFLFMNSDIVSVHVPLTSETRNLITKETLLCMQPDALLINTSRGGIVNERDLFDVLESGHLGGAAIDVFEDEPYQGCLTATDRVILTCHMGSMTRDCRARMESEATSDALRHFDGQPLQGLVPESEYEARATH